MNNGMIGLGMLALTLSACTIEQQGTESKKEFHPPLKYQSWETQSFTNEFERKVCAITSGYNGLTVYLSRVNGKVVTSVKSERKLVPGAFLGVNVNGNHYRTSEEFFSADESIKLANDLAAGDKAYVTWSEVHGDHHGRVRSTNIIKLDGFKSRSDECQSRLRLK